ncbi:MAG TPA: hypothetical protein VLH15_11570 [Dehalococcoidales bacterium]|nr:hypothetical protein [Dehalococcoidales bacterium]
MPTKRNINIGATRSYSGNLPAQQFTGQRLDGDGVDAVISAISTGLSVARVWLTGAGFRLGWDI